MKKNIIYIMLAAMALTGCKTQNEVNEPADGQQITLSFSMASEMSLDAQSAPARITAANPGDPGKDDFVAPAHLYFIVAAQTLTGPTDYMAAVHVSGLTASDWENAGSGIYTLKDKTYTFTLPGSGAVSVLTNESYYIYGFASTENLLNGSNQLGGITFGAYSPTDGKQALTTTNAASKATLDALSYTVPAGVSGQEATSAFFRSMYSTALSETPHNHMATSPTIRLRHTAAKLDIQWECDETVHTTGLTPNSTWTIATTSFPTAFSLFTPGTNTGATNWSETITIDEGSRYNGRYVTYLPMPATPTFTVTSSTDNLDGASQTKTLALTAGTDPNYATWMRALWTIK